MKKIRAMVEKWPIILIFIGVFGYFVVGYIDTEDCRNPPKGYHTEIIPVAIFPSSGRTCRIVPDDPNSPPYEDTSPLSFHIVMILSMASAMTGLFFMIKRPKQEDVSEN